MFPGQAACAVLQNLGAPGIRGGQGPDPQQLCQERGPESGSRTAPRGESLRRRPLFYIDVRAMRYMLAHHGGVPVALAWMQKGVPFVTAGRRRLRATDTTRISCGRDGGATFVGLFDAQRRECVRGRA
jgi:hypothetical protein